MDLHVGSCSSKAPEGLELSLWAIPSCTGVIRPGRGGNTAWPAQQDSYKHNQVAARMPLSECTGTGKQRLSGTRSMLESGLMLRACVPSWSTMKAVGQTVDQHHVVGDSCQHTGLLTQWQIIMTRC